MADIAFLLLIFFLVTTEIVEDKGILVKLPPWNESVPPATPRSNNIFAVLINKNDELLVRGEATKIAALRQRVKTFILNPAGSAELASTPNKAVISLQNDRGTTYGAYLTVYNELQAAYRELWNEQALRDYGHVYNEELPVEYRRNIRRAIPLVISEAEPTAFGQ